MKDLYCVEKDRFCEFASTNGRCYFSNCVKKERMINEELTNKPAETEEQEICRLEAQLKSAYEELEYFQKKLREFETINKNLLILLGNPWIKIESVDE